MALINNTNGLDQLNLVYIGVAGAIIGIGLGVYYIKRQNRKNLAAQQEAEIDQMIKGTSRHKNDIEDVVLNASETSTESVSEQLERAMDTTVINKNYTVIEKTDSSAEPIRIDTSQTTGDLKEILKNLAEQKGFSLTDFTATTTTMTGDDIEKLKNDLKIARLNAKEGKKE